METRIMRSTTDRKIAGVAGGLGQAMGVDPVFVRLGFVVLTLTSGVGVLLYVLLWLALPEADGHRVIDDVQSKVRGAVQSIGGTSEPQARFDPQTGEPINQPSRRDSKLGFVLLAVGGLMLASMLHVSGPIIALAFIGAGWYLLRNRNARPIQ